MDFFSFIFFIAIAFVLVSLHGRMRNLEQIIKGGQTPQKATQVPDDMRHQLMDSTAMPVPTDTSAAFFHWLKDDWLLKLGAFLLLIAFGWLTTFAFLNNWVGPMGRIVIGIMAGVVFLALGWWRIKKYIHQGSVFLVLGSTTILITIFAAREIYGFFTPLSALSIMFLSTAFVALASVKYNNQALALSSLILAGIAPLFTNAPQPNYAGLFLYLLIVVLGTLWVVFLTGRRELTAAALLLLVFYSLPHLVSLVRVDREVLLLFEYTFAALFFLTNTIGILKAKDKKIAPDLVAAAGNGLLLLAWIMAAAPDEWKSLIIVAWMAVFAVGAFSIFKITGRKVPFYGYAGVSIAMLAAATSAELKGSTLIIAYIIESGMISLITYAVLKDIKIAERMNWLFIVPAFLSFGSIFSPLWATGILHKDFFVLFILGASLLGLGSFFLESTHRTEDKEPRQINAALLNLGAVYAYILLWRSLHAGIENDNRAVMLAMIAYTIIGIFCYFYGLANQKRGLKLHGGILIGFVVARLLFIDVWRMELAGRIVTFFAVGALLVGTAFLGKKKQL